MAERRRIQWGMWALIAAVVVAGGLVTCREIGRAHYAATATEREEAEAWEALKAKMDEKHRQDELARRR